MKSSGWNDKEEISKKYNIAAFPHKFGRRILYRIHQGSFFMILNGFFA